jgi:hypothetical protein
MSDVAIHTRSSPRSTAVLAALLTALLVALAIFTFAITRDRTGSSESIPTPVAHQASTTAPECVWRHRGWFC